MYDLDKSSKAQEAMRHFREGYNCAQSVLLTFCKEAGLGEEQAAALASSFGGGMGRLREVCGAVSGMLLAAGGICGYADPADRAAKTRHYELVQFLAEEFRQAEGSIVCRELLHLEQKSDRPVPEERTAEYYRKRPCAELVGRAACILERYLKERTGGL